MKRWQTSDSEGHYMILILYEQLNEKENFMDVRAQKSILVPFNQIEENIGCTIW